jgi:hypothetical protein
VTWIGRLKALASEAPEQVPLEQFSQDTNVDTGQNIEEFFGMISTMLGVKPDDDSTELLNRAWYCFSKYSSRECPHCLPDVKNGTTQNVVRVLTFTPRERMGISFRKAAAIVGMRLLVFEKDTIHVIKPDRINQSCT